MNNHLNILGQSIFIGRKVICQHVILGGYAAENRGADYVKYLVPSLRARTRYLTGHREPLNQATLAYAAPGAGQHRDYPQTPMIMGTLVYTYGDVLTR